MTSQPRLYHYTCLYCFSSTNATKGEMQCQCGMRMIREDEWRLLRHPRNRASRRSVRH